MPKSPIFTDVGTYYGDVVTLAATTATASGNSATTPSAEYHTLRLMLSVTAVSGGTPSMTVTIQTSHDGATWVAVGSFAARTATGSERKTFSGLDRYVRASWVISGTTPSFTFTVSGEAV